MVIQMLTSSCISFRNSILNLYIRCIWFNAKYIMPIFIAQHCNMTVPLVQHIVIPNDPLYGALYLKV